jgi:hypothetical protein
LPDTDDATKSSTAVAFKVSPTTNDIDSLKKAVKVENANDLKDIDARHLKVYACIGEGVWAEVSKASTPLIGNTEETAYHVVVQF